jgi:D-sedoheptulose 7-phosphate isomerase
MNPKDPVRASFEEAASVLSAVLGDATCLENVRRFAQSAAMTVKAGGQLLSCGNGGSMCDAMHFAEEWTGRFRKDRSAVPAIAFSDPYGKKGDLLVALSTSGDSKNILRALEVAKSKGIASVGLLGKGGGKAKGLVDIPIVVPLATTSDRIQEIHIKVLHIVIEAVERELFPANYAQR